MGCAGLNGKGNVSSGLPLPPCLPHQWEPESTFLGKWLPSDILSQEKINKLHRMWKTDVSQEEGQVGVTKSQLCRSI